MKILQLCHKPLAGSPDGGKLAMLSLREGLELAGASVFSWMIETPAHRINEHDRTPGNSKSFFIDTRVKPLPALLSLIRGSSYNLERFNVTALRTALKDVAATFKPDVILAEGIYTLASFSETDFRDDMIVLRSHNIEHLIWERMAESEKNLLKKWYYRKLASALKREEIKIWQKVKGVLAISDQDALYIRKHAGGIPVSSVAIGFDVPQIQPRKFSGNDFFHLGAMDWRPNLEGMRFFLSEIWPGLKKEHSDIRFFLAGKGMPDEFRNKEDEGVFVEEAPNAVQFMLEKGVMIVPLLSGSGIRVKIIEGLIHGVPVITTHIGFEGIPAQPGKQLLVANDYESFRMIFRDLASRPELLDAVSENAVKFAAENYRKEFLGQKALKFIRELN